MPDKTANKKTNIFLKKNTSYFCFLKMSHNAENVKGGTLWDLLTYILLQNIKNSKGDSFDTFKNFRKKTRAVPNKIERGPFSLVRFCKLRLKSEK